MSNSQDTGAAATPAAPASDSSNSSEMPKIIELPKPVEAVMKAAADLKMADAGKAPVGPREEPAIVLPAEEIAEDSRASRFALLAASVAFAGALGAMAGALGTSAALAAAPDVQHRYLGV